MVKKIINGNLKWVLGFILAIAGATVPGIIAYGTISEKVARIEIDIACKADKDLINAQFKFVNEKLIGIQKTLDELDKKDD